MRRLVIAAVAVLALASVADAKPNCKRGVPCGNTCISVGMACNMNPPKPAATPTHMPTSVLHCSTGTPCGNTCIRAGETCHKP